MMTATPISSVIATGVAAAAIAVPALAAGPTVTLNLKDGLTKRELVACGIRHHYTLFHVGRSIAMDGSIQPVPSAAWRVKVKVKKCSRGRFRTVWARHTKGKKNGTFTISYTPRRAGAYFARAYYYGVRPAVRSGKQYFHS
jgi:hypothetical protein